MPTKINLYNLGAIGVDIVSSPVHLPDGGFVSAQNSSSSPEDAEQSLQKRPGISQLATPAFPASIIAIHSIRAGS